MQKMSVEQFVQPASQSYIQAIRTAGNAVHVCMPCTVVSYNKDEQTVCAVPLITGKANDSRQQYPMLLDVPVFFPGGKDTAFTFAVNAGDDCLVVFADSCIDGWFQRGDMQAPYLDRKHDLSDGFALVGFRPVPRFIKMEDDYAVAIRVLANGQWKVPFAADASGNAYINGVKA